MTTSPGERGYNMIILGIAFLDFAPIHAAADGVDRMASATTLEKPGVGSGRLFTFDNGVKLYRYWYFGLSERFDLDFFCPIG